MTEDKLDREIDRAVRHMMRAESRPGMRARVLARLDGAPRRAWLRPSIAVAAMTAAAVLLAVFLFRPNPAVAPGLDVARSQPPAPEAAAPPPAQPAVERVPGQSTATAATPGAAPAPVSRGAQPQAPRREELPPPPRVDDVFGPRSNRVSAADAGKAQAPAKTANLRLEFVFTLEGEGMDPARKTVTMVVADRQMGRHRSAEGDHVVIEARPSILADGRVQVAAKLEYRARGSDGAGLVDSVSTVLDDAQALVVSKASDSRAKRQISVELKATTLK
jgi:hypothetical protein